jgi:hypothetical protein
MRDPQRIPRILEKLRKVWEHSPDLRLGQLVENALKFSTNHNSDTFNVEDDAMERGLDTLAWLSQPDPIPVIINGVEHTVMKRKLTYDEIVFRATEGLSNALHSVTFSKALGDKKEGILFPGQSVVVKSGTIFNAYITDNT